MNNKNVSKGEKPLKNQNIKIENLTKVEDLYRLKVGNMCVDMAYCKNNKSFNDCILNILKQKIKKCWHIHKSTLQY